MKKLLFAWILSLGMVVSGQGQKSKIQSEYITQGDDRIEVVVVSGTPHEMGFELGKHLKEKALETVKRMLGAAQMEDSVHLSVKKLLQAWKTNEPFMDKRFLEEMDGFAEGSGIDVNLLKAAHTLPMVSPYSCSGVDAWGKATSNEHLYQIRNLDYAINAGLQTYPVVVIYKPTKGVAHANVAFSGMMSSHTGINAQSIVLGEIGESPASQAPYDLHGKHFTIMFREILYDAKKLSDAEHIIENSPLMKRYYFFVGDGKLKEHAAVKYLISTPDPVHLHKWSDNDPTDTLVPKVYNNIVYKTMKNDVAVKLLDEFNGHIGSKEMIQLSQAVAVPKNLVDVVYDATALEMWVAFATSTQPASARQYIHLDLKKYFK